MEKNKDKTPEKGSEGDRPPVSVMIESFISHFPIVDEGIIEKILISSPSPLIEIGLKDRGKDKYYLKEEDEETKALHEERAALLAKRLPPTFKQGREAALQLSKVERDLFTDIEEEESGNYIVSGLTKRVSELDFTAFTFAVGQILYNQSYQCGNADVNSGVAREVATRLSQSIGSTQYLGVIQTTLKEICLKGYGAATTELRARMETVIDILDRTRIRIRYPNGDEEKTFLCLNCYEYRRARDGAVEYILSLNPIFGSHIHNHYGELPQDIIQRLDDVCKKKKQRKQAAHYLLLRWLCIQDKRYPHTLTTATLLKELRMEEYFRESASKAEKQLLSVCEAMRGVGILESYESKYITIRNKQRISKITFYLKKDFLREQPKEIQQQPLKEEEVCKKRKPTSRKTPTRREGKKGP